MTIVRRIARMSREIAPGGDERANPMRLRIGG
jgi:hypothetical protein